MTIPLSDPDGDIVKIDLVFYAGSTLLGRDSFSSPFDFNLAGRTDVTLTLREYFNPAFSVTRVTRVDITATDAKGNMSGAFTALF